MSHPEPSGPDLDGVVADADAVGLPYVVIGGFGVMANGFVRATKATSKSWRPSTASSPKTRSPASTAETRVHGRAIRDFFFQEVDRDKSILYGGALPVLIPAGEHPVSDLSDTVYP